MAGNKMEDSSTPLVDISEFLLSPLGVHNLQSSVPAVCLEEESFMGIDEAGRGPVLGPMVYGTCYCPLSKLSELEHMKFADSKTLSEDQRETSFRQISDSVGFLGWKTTLLSPSYISNCMLRRTKYNLNDISHDTAIDLIQKVISDGVKLCEVYVDTVGDPRKYQSKLSEIFPQLKITVAKKADSLFPIVSAASICAKVTRDACLKEWKFVEKDIKISTKYGSGYPSDPDTKQWLRESLDTMFGYPAIVRFSWSTCQEKLDSKALPIQWFPLVTNTSYHVLYCLVHIVIQPKPDEDEDDGTKGYAKISQFFSPNGTMTSKPLKRHRFFEERKLTTIDHF